jgi:hypothetical protein
VSAAIKVEQATISTATITIRTLTIDRRQVTLAVFRQLEEQEPVDSSAKLLGIPWGRVNYHPDGCKRKGHVHVVWQTGDELRRGTLAEPCEPLVCHQATHWLRRATAEGWTPKTVPDAYQRSVQIRLVDDLPAARAYYDQDMHNAWTNPKYFLETLQRSVEHWPSTVDLLERAQRAWRTDVEGFYRYRDEIWPAILDLPQLFIAA